MRQIILTSKDVERFWAKVDKNGPIPKHCPELGPCWLWTDHRKGRGYGGFRVGGGNCPAHRVSWAIANGGDPGEFLIRHRCDNPPCVNPAHLLQGTAKNNVDDMYSRNRAPYPTGENNRRAKLTEQDVRDIRASLACGEKHRVIADRYGVKQPIISSIGRRAAWSHVDDGFQRQDRSVQGERHGMARLIERDIIEIREAATSGETQTSLAKRFGVSFQQISKIVRRVRWAHVGEDSQ